MRARQRSVIPRKRRRCGGVWGSAHACSGGFAAGARQHGRRADGGRRQVRDLLYKGADREQRLAEKARAEGTLTLYTSMATTESAPLALAFEKKYGVKVQLWRALSENVLQRALTEARGGRRGMDVVETNAPEVEALGREQVVARIRQPAPRRSAGLGDPAAPALVQRPRQSVGRRLQHRQGQARGAAGDARRLRRAEMEGPHRARGDRQRLDVRRHRLHGRGSAGSNSSAGSRRSSPTCARAMPGGAARRRRRIAGVPHGLQRQRRLDQEQGRADRLGRGRAAGRTPAGAGAWRGTRRIRTPRCCSPISCCRRKARSCSTSMGRVPASRTQKTLLDRHQHVMVDPIKWTDEAPQVGEDLERAVLEVDADGLPKTKRARSSRARSCSPVASPV